jgi:transposase-like protein
MKQPTKPNTNTNKNKDIITIGDEWTGEDRPSYICSWCSRVLTRLTNASQSNISWFCRNCNITFDPDLENVRRESKLIVPNRNEAAVTSIQNNMADEVEIRHTPPIRGGFAELQKKGLKITSYKTSEKE